jgi:type II secretory pathway pseudopilin PulG
MDSRKLHDPPAREAGREAGVGLVEIVVAMFMLGILAVSFLPVLIQGIKQSAVNATNATATSLAYRQLELARAQLTCQGLVSFTAGAGIPLVETDPRGVQMQVTRANGDCVVGDTYPRTVTFSSVVKRLDTNRQVIKVDTRVYLESFNG